MQFLVSTVLKFLNWLIITFDLPLFKKAWAFKTIFCYSFLNTKSLAAFEEFADIVLIIIAELLFIVRQKT